MLGLDGGAGAIPTLIGCYIYMYAVTRSCYLIVEYFSAVYVCIFASVCEFGHWVSGESRYVIFDPSSQDWVSSVLLLCMYYLSYMGW